MDEVRRGDLWWADLPSPRGSEPGYRRPVVIVQADSFNRSGLRTVTVAVITSNVRLADAPGNVLLEVPASGLPRDSVVNVSQIMTLDRDFLTEKISRLPPEVMTRIGAGLRLILGLGPQIVR